MKVIIAGSRKLWINDDLMLKIIRQFYKMHKEKITEIVSGNAEGVDKCGERFAEDFSIRLKRFPANWEDLSHPDARIITRKDGTQYDANAGHRRNQEMADYADALIAIPIKGSTGTWDMIRKAKRKGLKIYIVDYWL